jgi:hypothetical protein
MKLAAAVGVLLLAVAAALWLAWRQGFVGEAALPGPLPAFQAHLLARGIDTVAQPVRRDLAEVQAHVHFKVLRSDGQVFFVLWCNSPEAAQRHLKRLQAAPSPSLPEANGSLVIYLTDWKAEEPLTRKVLEAFRSFDAARHASM